MITVWCKSGDRCYIYRRKRSHVAFSRYCVIKTKVWKWLYAMTWMAAFRTEKSGSKPSSKPSLQVHDSFFQGVALKPSLISSAISRTVSHLLCSCFWTHGSVPPQFWNCYFVLCVSWSRRFLCNSEAVAQFFLLLSSSVDPSSRIPDVTLSSFLI